MIERVERFKPDLQARAFAKIKILKQRRIP